MHRVSFSSSSSSSFNLTCSFMSAWRSKCNPHTHTHTHTHKQDCVNACKATWPVVKADILNECEDEEQEQEIEKGIILMQLPNNMYMLHFGFLNYHFIDPHTHTYLSFSVPPSRVQWRSATVSRQCESCTGDSSTCSMATGPSTLMRMGCPSNKRTTLSSGLTMWSRTMASGVPSRPAQRRMLKRIPLTKLWAKCA